MALLRLGNRLWLNFCKSYQASVVSSLNQYGLKYDDIKVEDEDYQKALSRMSPEELQLRARRFKRAFDIDVKRKYLPEDLQKLQQPLEPYATKLIDDAKERRIEREILNTYN
ncbi:hypothetical protein CTAYLR_009293 [Chrysophaeum taylorii]|uniref:Cytochrome b-c1 complex subunit 7 n=1 Tax=Chrysophaeum taylorii TaxID=2483200 RepID=A0AAD7UJK3_9STRA|nr:hypothetical protein CTAYLR_009293 [Chrysophaeum taylorii]